jgi:hypothetical protein
MFGTTSERFAVNNVVDYQRWLKALGCYTPATTDWLLVCMPEPLPVAQPGRNPYMLPSTNFCAPLGADKVPDAELMPLPSALLLPTTFIRGKTTVRDVHVCVRVYIHPHFTSVSVYVCVCMSVVCKSLYFCVCQRVVAIVVRMYASNMVMYLSLPISLSLSLKTAGERYAPLPVTPPDPPKFPLRSNANVPVTNRVDTRHVRVITKLLYDLPYEMTLLKAMMRSYTESLTMQPSLIQRLTEAARVRACTHTDTHTHTQTQTHKGCTISHHVK